MNGAILPPSHTPLRRAHGQLYRYLHDREGYQRMLRVHTLLPMQLQIISLEKQLQRSTGTCSTCHHPTGSQ